MYEKSNNPIVEELTKSHKGRRINLSLIKVQLIDGIKSCAWCSKVITSRQKYCSQTCADHILAWANPQKEYGLNMLLARQDFKCNICQYDYKPLISQLLINGRVYDKPADYTKVYSYYLMRRIKSKSEQGREPEVDHVVAISKGGQSLGFENHQAICKTCHKVKTKVDNSGPRKKRITK